MILLAMALLSAAGNAEMSSTSVLVDGDIVRIFDNDAAAQAGDRNACFNAYADPRAKRVIKRNNKARRPSILTIKFEKDFFSFDNSGVERSYHFKGKPIVALCRRTDLAEIISAR
jgi:hypothetical protein